MQVEEAERSAGAADGTRWDGCAGAGMRVLGKHLDLFCSFFDSSLPRIEWPGGGPTWNP